MNIKDNRRVQITKKMIKESFLELLDEKDIHNVTVRELCIRADVNRATFYRYYADQYALLEEISTEFFSTLDLYLKDSVKDTILPLIKALDYISDNIDVVKLLLFNNVNDDLPSILLTLPSISNALLTTFPEKNNWTTDYIREYTIYGSYRIIMKWLKNNCMESSTDIAELIYKLNHSL